jgi:hypothetical protein
MGGIHDAEKFRKKEGGNAFANSIISADSSLALGKRNSFM